MPGPEYRGFGHSATGWGLFAAPLSSHTRPEPPGLPRTMFLCGGWNLLTSLLLLISWVCSLHSCKVLLSLEKKHSHIKVTSQILLQAEFARSAVISASQPSPIDLSLELVGGWEYPPFPKPPPPFAGLLPATLSRDRVDRFQLRPLDLGCTSCRRLILCCGSQVPQVPYWPGRNQLGCRPCSESW